MIKKTKDVILKKEEEKLKDIHEYLDNFISSNLTSNELELKQFIELKYSKNGLNINRFMLLWSKIGEEIHIPLLYKPIKNFLLKTMNSLYEVGLYNCSREINSYITIDDILLQFSKIPGDRYINKIFAYILKFLFKPYEYKFNIVCSYSVIYIYAYIHSLIYMIR